MKRNIVFLSIFVFILPLTSNATVSHYQRWVEQSCKQAAKAEASGYAEHYRESVEKSVLSLCAENKAKTLQRVQSRAGNDCKAKKGAIYLGPGDGLYCFSGDDVMGYDPTGQTEEGQGFRAWLYKHGRGTILSRNTLVIDFAVSNPDQGGPPSNDGDESKGQRLADDYDAQTFCLNKPANQQQMCLACLENLDDDASEEALEKCFEEAVATTEPDPNRPGDPAGDPNRYFTGGGVLEGQNFARSCVSIFGQVSTERTSTGTEPPTYEVGSSACERRLAEFRQCEGAADILACVDQFSETFCGGHTQCVKNIYNMANLRDSDSIWQAVWNAPGSNMDSSLWHLVNKAGMANAEFHELEQCKDQSEITVDCCKDPMSCAVGNKAVGKGANAILTLAQVLGAQGGAGVIGVGEACRLLKDASTATSVLNFTLSGMCTKKVDTCVELCDGVREKFKKAVELAELKCQQYQSLQYVSDICNSRIRKLASKDSDLRSKSGLCNNQMELAHGMEQNAAKQVAASGFAKDCEDEVKASETGFEGLPDNDTAAFNNDCRTAANANNPVCIRCNADPSAPGCDGVIVDPNLGVPGGGGGGGIGGGFGGPLGGGVAGLDTSVIPEFDDPFSNPEFADPMAVESGQRNDPTMGSGGGGGGLAGGSGGGGGGLDPLSKPGSANGRLKTDILTGERGGQGAVSSMGFSGGGGGFSYGRSPSALARKGLIKAHKKSGFDLKKYLPGKKGKAKLPGLGRSPATLGKSTDDIFKMISRRYRLRCMQGQFYGCPGGGVAPKKK